MMMKSYVATALIALSQGLKLEAQWDPNDLFPNDNVTAQLESTTGSEPALTAGVHDLLAQKKGGKPSCWWDNIGWFNEAECDDLKKMSKKGWEGKWDSERKQCWICD